MPAELMSGVSQRKNGVTKRDVLSADITSVEALKINSIQPSTGSQYLTNRDFIL